MAAARHGGCAGTDLEAVVAGLHGGNLLVAELPRNCAAGASLVVDAPYCGIGDGRCFSVQPFHIIKDAARKMGGSA